MIMKDWMTSTEGMCHTISLPTKLIEVLSLHCFRGISGKKFLDPKNSSNIDLPYLLELEPLLELGPMTPNARATAHQRKPVGRCGVALPVFPKN